MNLTGEAIRGMLVLAVLGALAIWLMVHTIRNAEEPSRMAFNWVLTLPLVTLIVLSLRLLGALAPFLVAICGIVLSFLWTPHLVPFLIKPLTSIFDGGDLPPDPAPAYSVARSKQKRGRYLEAVADVRKQLERFPTDVEGHLLLGMILLDERSIEPAIESLRRAAFLDATCAGDESLRREVEALLASHERAGDLFEMRAVATIADVLAHNQAASMTGQKLGPYKLISRLGGGGMGEIHLARFRKDPRAAAGNGVRPRRGPADRAPGQPGRAGGAARTEKIRRAGRGS